jgi:hypothetical protein
MHRMDNSDIRLEVKSKAVVAGSYLSGSCSAGICSLYFTGTECTKVVYTSSSSGSSGHPHESYSTVTIVRSIINIDSPRRASAKAPFQFYIPDQLPSSMYHKDGNGSYICVSYQLKLQLGREVIEVIPLRVIAKPSLDPLRRIVSEDHVRRRIMLAGCIPKGFVETSIKVDNTRLGSGEVMTIDLEILNNSSVDIEWISATLIEQVDWHSRGHCTSDKIYLASQKFPDTLAMKSNARKRQGMTKIQPNNSQDSDYRSIMTSSSKVRIRIPDNSLQTYEGNMFEVKHYLSIKAKTRCGYTNVKIHIPVAISSSKKYLRRI